MRNVKEEGQEGRGEGKEEKKPALEVPSFRDQRKPSRVWVAGLFLPCFWLGFCGMALNHRDGDSDPMARQPLLQTVWAIEVFGMRRSPQRSAFTPSRTDREMSSSVICPWFMLSPSQRHGSRKPGALHGSRV